MSAVLKLHNKFSFDELTQGIFHDLLQQADDDTNVCDAIEFRANHPRDHALVDQLVSNGFIIYDMSNNSYRLHTPFIRVLDSLYLTAMLSDLNRLLGAFHEIDLQKSRQRINIVQLSAHTELSIARIASLSHYLHWLGLLTAPVPVGENSGDLHLSDSAHQFNDIEGCMDHALDVFDVSNNIPHPQLDTVAQTTNEYSTPMLDLLQDTMKHHFAGREFDDQPDKEELMNMLREKSVNGKKISKKMAEAIYEILHAPKS